MILNFWNYLRGYVRIEVSGFSVERFMNLVVNKNIYVWDIEYKSGKVKMNVYINGYKQLKHCARKTKCKIKILQKYGLPFFNFKYRKRKVLFAGVGVFVFIIYFMSTFIWSINITGNDNVETYEILEYLKTQNIHVGTRKKNINTIELEEKLRKEFDFISWVNVQSKGTVLNINTSEILEDKEVEEEKEPSNIVAEKEGLITHITVKNGTPNVKKGDVVKEGDVLVSGEVFLNEDENGKHYRYTYSEADIKAKRYYDISFFVPYEYESYEYTKNTKNRYSLLFGNKKINLYFNRNLYNNYDIIEKNMQLTFGENYPTPIVLKKTTFLEKQPVSMTRTKEESQKYANKVITDKIINDVDFSTDIYEKNISFQEREDGLDVSVELTTIEDIGVEELIVLNEEIDELE